MANDARDAKYAAQDAQSRAQALEDDKALETIQNHVRDLSHRVNVDLPYLIKGVNNTAISNANGISNHLREQNMFLTES
jgi:hypothetical protein